MSVAIGQPTIMYATAGIRSFTTLRPITESVMEGLIQLFEHQQDIKPTIRTSDNTTQLHDLAEGKSNHWIADTSQSDNHKNI